MLNYEVTIESKSGKSSELNFIADSADQLKHVIAHHSSPHWFYKVVSAKQILDNKDAVELSSEEISSINDFVKNNIPYDHTKHAAQNKRTSTCG